MNKNITQSVRGKLIKLKSSPARIILQKVLKKKPINSKSDLSLSKTQVLALSLSNPMSEFHNSDHQKSPETQKPPEEGDRTEEDGGGGADGGGGEIRCRTPTSLRHRIPTARSCPPTPRKRKVVSKRKLPDQSFFEATGSGEVESLFGLFYRVSSAKRRCTSV